MGRIRSDKVSKAGHLLASAFVSILGMGIMGVSLLAFSQRYDGEKDDDVHLPIHGQIRPGRFDQSGLVWFCLTNECNPSENVKDYEYHRANRLRTDFRSRDFGSTSS